MWINNGVRMTRTRRMSIDFSLILAGDVILKCLFAQDFYNAICTRFNYIPFYIMHIPFWYNFFCPRFLSFVGKSMDHVGH
jgi:hypothetical protein